jgi:hypothetical protein
MLMLIIIIIIMIIIGGIFRRENHANDWTKKLPLI